MEAMEKSLGRMEAMLGMLMAVNGLASPDERLAVEKRKGRWPESGMCQWLGRPNVQRPRDW